MTRLDYEEQLAFDAQELVAEMMEFICIDKGGLALKYDDCSKAKITQLLSGSRRMTMHTLAGLACVMGYKVTLQAVPIMSTTGDIAGAQQCGHTEDADWDMQDEVKGDD